MKSNSCTQNDTSPVKMYKSIMSGIEFMEKYMEDDDIFNADSTSFKTFLIQSFCFLYPDFHYLSFLRKEDIDLEIVKVAGILQILPEKTKKITKLFDGMTKDDVHKFWLKFFILFKKKNDFSTSSLFNLSWENKIDFFKDMTSTLNYLNYEFPVVNMKKFNCVNVDTEIDSWKDQVITTVSASDELMSFKDEEEQAPDVDIEKLSICIKQVLSMYSNQKFVHQQNEPEHTEFFLRFIDLTKNILQYRRDLAIISSTVLDDFNVTKFSSDEIFQENLYFLKRFNNSVSNLRSKIKTLY